jgi:hypothetical protein
MDREVGIVDVPNGGIVERPTHQLYHQVLIRGFYQRSSAFITGAFDFLA